MKSKINKLFKLVILSLLLMSAGMAYSQTATLTIPGQDAEVGPVVVPLTCTEISADPVSGIQFYVNWDPLVLTYTGWSDFFTTEGAPTVNEGNIAAGELIIVWSENAPFGNISITAPTTFMNLNFDFAGGMSTVFWGTTTKGVYGWPEKGITTMASFAPPIFFPPFALTYVDGYVQEGGGAIDYMWVGGFPGCEECWDQPDNWLPVGIPGPADNVTFEGTKAGPCTLTGPAIVTNVTITGGTLNIAPSGQLDVTGTFTNNGFFYVLSDGAGFSGSFIDALGVTGGGMYEFQREITNVTPMGSQAGWHLVSSPLLAGQFTSDALYYYYLNYFDATTQLYVPVVGSQPCVPAATMPNNFMEGWSIKYDDQYAANCAGGMEDYVINMGGVFNDALTVAQAGVVTGYNLLGNPFASAIDPTAFSWPVSVPTNSGWMWDGLSGANAWVIFDGTGIGGNVPPTQGFFLQATGPGTLDVTGARIHDTPLAWYKDAADYLKLKATVEGALNADVTYIRFNDAATAGLDKEWDGLKMFNNVEQTPDIYTHTGDNDLSINTQPAVDMVPMSFVCETAGTYTIEAVETGSFGNVVLEDVVTGEQTDLLAGSYTFDYNSVSEVHPFIVHFTPLGMIEHDANSIRIWGANQTVNVVVPETTGTIHVYNMMGQEVVSADAQPGLNTLPVRDVNTYYVVKVVTENNAKTGKVFIK